MPVYGCSAIRVIRSQGNYAANKSSAHMAAEHLAPYADRLCALRVVETGSDQAVAEDGHVLVTASNEKALA